MCESGVLESLEHSQVAQTALGCSDNPCAVICPSLAGEIHLRPYSLGVCRSASATGDPSCDIMLFTIL